MSVAKKKVRITISLLLALCLLPIVTKTSLPIGAQDIGSGKKTALFAHAIESYVVSAFTVGKRTNLNFFEGFSSESILRQTLFDYTRESSLFLPQYNASFSHRSDRTAFPIRAPPFRQHF
jgi:hypothetical protein